MLLNGLGILAEDRSKRGEGGGEGGGLREGEKRREGRTRVDELSISSWSARGEPDGRRSCEEILFTVSNFLFHQVEFSAPSVKDLLKSLRRRKVSWRYLLCFFSPSKRLRSFFSPQDSRFHGLRQFVEYMPEAQIQSISAALLFSGHP